MKYWQRSVLSFHFFTGAWKFIALLSCLFLCVVALKYFQKVAESNDVKASQGMYNLAVMYQHGKGVAQSNERARSFLKQAADLGHKQAIEQLAEWNRLNDFSLKHFYENMWKYEHSKMCALGQLCQQDGEKTLKSFLSLRKLNSWVMDSKSLKTTKKSDFDINLFAVDQKWFDWMIQKFS